MNVVSYTNLGFTFLDVGSKGEYAVKSNTEVYRIYGMCTICPKPADVEFVFGPSVYEIECTDVSLLGFHAAGWLGCCVLSVFTLWVRQWKWRLSTTPVSAGLWQVVLASCAYFSSTICLSCVCLDCKLYGAELSLTVHLYGAYNNGALFWALL